jgi:uncharacterized protein
VGIAAASNTPILKSQRKPKDFRNPTIKTDRSLTRDSSYVAEFVKTPTRSKTQRSNSRTRKPRCSTVFACLSTETDDGAALRDILFTRWEQRFSAPQITGRRRSAAVTRYA